MSDADLLEARRKALEARLVESGKVPRQTLRPPLDPLTARAKAVQDRLAEAYRARRGKVEESVQQIKPKLAGKEEWKTP